MRRVAVGNAPEDLAAFCHAEFPRLVGIRLGPPRQVRDHADAAVDAEAMRALVASLPAAQRSVVALRFFADRSVRETAAILSLTEDAVKAHTKRAMTTMRVELGPASEVDTDV